jgi:hypothetical protein
MSFELHQKLARVAGRIRSLRLWNGLALCWLAWAVIGVVLLQLSGRFGWDTASIWPKVAGLAMATAIVWSFAVFRTARDQCAVARRVEAQHPELATLLLTAVEVAQLPRTPGKGPGFLQATVLREALEHGRRSDWSDAVSAGNLRVAKLAQFLALGLLVAVCIGMASRGGASAGSRRSLVPGLDVSGGAFDVKVDPGNVEIERGTSLLVVAEFPRDIPPEATLVVTSEASSPDSTAKATDEVADQSAEKAEQLDMVRSLDDPKFVGRVASVTSDLTYRVSFARRSSDTYHVKVFDYPELVRADAELAFPDYTSLAPTIVEDVRHVTAVEGTHLTLVCRLNKQVVEARLVAADDQSTDLRQDSGEKNVYRASWTLTKSQRFKLQLVDRDGRGNRLPAEIIVNVTPNRPPKITLERPARDVEVSPLEELQLKAKVTDDFGIRRYGVSYALGGDEPHEIVLPEGANRQVTSDARDSQPKQQDVDYLVDFESLAVEPDQLLSYFVWAEDFGPDGKLRRTMSDMYFAEVRPFEEIYRQGEQPSESEQQRRQQQGEGGTAQEAGELADMQKDIINATWKLIRRESASEPTAELASDSRLVAESQQAAIARLNRLAERLQDAESLEHVQAAKNHMQEALKQLTASADGPSAAPLSPALGAEQSAYQSLLKLRAREFQVIRGSQQQGRSSMAGRSSRSQRQLNQLELSNEENRYETQRNASAPQETQAQRESREILNRLKDLARRQDDLNERLRELQSALQQADSQQRREELERELKRLRDQQQQILRDTDELMSRMDQSQNQQAAQNAREQMAEGRSRLQQASEALEQGQVSQAITEGTRAERQLSDVRDQYRQQAANRFSEEMTEMRRDARALDERQEQLSEQLSEQHNEGGRSLRGTGSREEAQEGLAQQRRNLSQLLDRIQQTITAAEQPEPLLARQLYDTLRETHQQRVDDALDVTRRLLEVGVEREADRAMRNASQGIRNLREGVERAAESVLGDEAEALRRAQQEVDRLAEELNREIAQNRGDEGADQQGSEQGLRGRGGRGERLEETRSPQRVSQSEANNDAQASQGEDQLAENQPGQDQRREGRQPGQGQSGQGNQREEQPNGQSRAGNRVRQGGEEQSPGQAQGEGAQQGQGDRPGGNRRGARNDNQQTNEQNENEGERAAGPEAQQQGRAEQAQTGGEGGGGRVGEAREQQSLRGGRQSSVSRGGGIERFLENGGLGGPGGPITGESFRSWSERIGDVEEMLDDPELRGEAARIRDRAADARAEFKRHSKLPDWNKLQELVAEPLNELSRRIGEEIKRRESPDSLVPIDRDPVPPEFADGVRRYYERLGSGE